MGKIKVIATIGLNSGKREMIEKMAEYVDGFRLNISHKTVDEAREQLRMIREVAEEKFVFFDLQGPKIRTNMFEEAVEVKEGDVLEYGKDISFDPEFSSSIPEGARILIDDGRIEGVWREGRIEIVKGGTIVGRKGVAVPGVAVPVSNPTERDMEFVKLGMEEGVDGFAMSFVQSGEDMERLRDLVGDDFYLISKVETRAAIDNLEGIVEASDMVMVARGDLGLELGFENLPAGQQRIVATCRKLRKPFIIATEIAQSMIRERRMTRAEVSDIYLSALQGADAIMLSSETTLSERPDYVVQQIHRIVEKMVERVDMEEPSDLTYLLGKSAVDMADNLSADEIIAITRSGTTAVAVSYYRPSTRLRAVTFSRKVQRFLNLCYGIEPELWEEMSVREIIGKFSEEKRGRRVIFVAGSGIKDDLVNDLVKYAEV